MSMMSNSARKAYDAVAERNGGRVSSLDAVYEELDQTLPAAAADEVRARAIRSAVQQEDERRTKKGNGIVRPSTQLNFQGIPSWLEPDAYLPTMDGGRFQVASGRTADWLPVLAEADKQADRANAARSEKYATFNEMAPYLIGGVTNVEAYQAFQRDHQTEAAAD